VISAATPERALPHAVDAEMALLGATMFDNEAFHLAGDIEPKHFYEPLHQKLWTAMAERIAVKGLAEPVGLAELLKDDPALQEFGGLKHLMAMVDAGAPTFTAKEHADLIIDRFVRRSLIGLGKDACALAADVSVSAWDRLAEVEAGLYALSERGPAGFVAAEPESHEVVGSRVDVELQLDVDVAAALVPEDSPDTRNASHGLVRSGAVTHAGSRTPATAFV